MTQLLLDHEIPILVVQIAPIPVDSFGAQALGLKQAQKRSQRIGEVGNVRRGKTIAARCALMRIAEVVVLVSAIIDSESSADDRFSLEYPRAPCQAQTGSEIVPV